MPTTFADPGPFPLASPTVSGTSLTVDLALQQPTRVTRRIADITLERFIASRIFAQGGPVSGGAVIFDQAVLNELYLTRDVEQRAPGDEYPIVTSQRLAPGVALVEDWGGKFDTTDEQRDRNDASLFNNKVTQLGNTIVRKVNTRAVDTLNAAVAAMAGATTFVGTNWNAVVTAGTSATSAAGYPAADLAKAQLAADVDELGVQYDLWLVNPAQKYQFNLVYGVNGGSPERVLADNGIREMFASNRIPAGTAYAVASQQVGELRLEQPLQTETWREPKTRRTWLQSSVKPVMYVTNPYSIRAVTGLAG
jgi:hypothetical protein